jgi:2-oxoglutarate ferredoxin oxidoreductase subunit gamma
MKHEVIFAGFGGQGVLTMGMILCYAGMKEGKEVCWMPSYGPEMRGGTANCITIVSDEQISSPIISRFDSVVALNQPSLDKFESAVKPGGNLFYDSTNILTPPTRTDINIFAIPASEEANKLNNLRVMNVIMLGAFLEVVKIVNDESIFYGFTQVLPERYHKLIPLNKEAFFLGKKISEEILARI